ncbi:hypothetical protein LWI29_007496 [Acer saccharum]|uniref:Uncharacterized protein n=1 Tax=Acer saccharum TaxID=4024 RepID=A0AA39S0Y2_ACESA|nr:hypothetical protein LWI29_007496 [Acer saccharum]
MVAAQVCQSQQVGRSEDSFIGVHVHSSRVGVVPVSSEGPSLILDVSAGAVVSISSAVSMVGQGSKVGRDSVSPLVSFAQPIVSSVVSVDELDDRGPERPLSDSQSELRLLLILPGLTSSMHKFLVDLKPYGCHLENSSPVLIVYMETLLGHFYY